MQKEKRLVEVIHEEVAKYLKNGSFAIDATVGNGHDTAYLSNLVGSEGRVLGFDIQLDALKSAKSRISQLNLTQVVDFQLVGHEKMLEVVPEGWLENVSVIMFNLGYMPGGDKAIITKKESTLKAVQASLKLLKSNGLLSIVMYPGHAGGGEEAKAVEGWASYLGEGYELMQKRSEAHNGPRWIGVLRK